MKIKVNELPNYNSKMPSSGKAIFSNWIPVDLSFQCCANIVVKKGIKKLDEVKKIEQKGQKANAYFDIVGRPQIFRSSQPYYKSKDEYQIYDDCTLKVLQDHGITRVLSLNEHKANEMNLAKAGIAYHHTQVPDFGPASVSQLLAACIFLHETPAYEGALVYCGYGQGRTGMMITAYQIYSYYRFFNNLTPSQVVSLRSFFDVYINASTAEENVQEVALRNFFDYLFMHWGEHGKVRTIPVHNNVITHTPSVTTSSKITTSTIPIPPAMPPKFVMKKALVTHNNPVIQNPVNTLNTNKLNIFNFQKSLTVFLSSLDEFEKLNIQIIDQLILGCTNYLNQSPKKYGQTGLKRSTDFKNELEKLKNSNKLLFNTKLTELVYKLFTNNQIGLKKYSDFLGFGGTIRTEETSLFTFCANSLINMNSFQNIILEKSSPLNNSALISALLNSPLTKVKLPNVVSKDFI